MVQHIHFTKMLKSLFWMRARDLLWLWPPTLGDYCSIVLIGSRLLAAYLIPACVGRGVRLRSESWSGTGSGGVSRKSELKAQGAGGGAKSKQLKSVNISKLKIRITQTVSSVLSGRNKNDPDHIGCYVGQFSLWSIFMKIQKYLMRIYAQMRI